MPSLVRSRSKAWDEHSYLSDLLGNRSQGKENSGIKQKKRAKQECSHLKGVGSGSLLAEGRSELWVPRLPAAGGRLHRVGKEVWVGLQQPPLHTQALGSGLRMHRSPSPCLPGAFKQGIYMCRYTIPLRGFLGFFCRTVLLLPCSLRTGRLSFISFSKCACAHCYPATLLS